MKMKNLKIFAMLPLILFSFGKLSSQVTIGSSNPPSPWSLLDLDNPESTDRHRALHLPRLYEAERNALVPPGATNVEARGLMIFNRDTRCLEFWNETEWISLCVDAPRTPSMFGTVWLITGARYVFDVNALTQDEMDCIIQEYGSVENFKNSARYSYFTVEYHLGVYFYFNDAGMWWAGFLDGDAVEWIQGGCWRWTNELKNEWCVFNDPSLVLVGMSCSLVEDSFYTDTWFPSLTSDNRFRLIINNTRPSSMLCWVPGVNYSFYMEAVNLDPPVTGTSSAVPSSRTLQNMPFGLFRSR